ncbi:MAG: hypothetical protein K2P80_05150 [Beijerinckiaceae bacterium]|nr:hypothetical protein [Beijerinckiaceae bacterium]
MSQPPMTADVPELGYRPVPGKTVTIEPRAFRRTSDYDCHEQGKNGHWRPAGWAYAITGKVARDCAATELSEPGGYRKRIQACRKALESAHRIPDHTVVAIDLLARMTRSQRETIDRILDRQAAGKPISACRTVDDVLEDGQAVLVVPWTNEDNYHLIALGPITRWILGGDEARAALAA